MSNEGTVALLMEAANKNFKPTYFRGPKEG
jgi:hypothetical protein